MSLTIVYKQVKEGYIGFVEELPGTNTQAETLAELKKNLVEAVHLVLEANRALSEEMILEENFQYEQLNVAAL